MKLLITGAFRWKDAQIKSIEEFGFEIRYAEREDEEIDFDVSDIDAVICNWLFVHHNIRKFSHLKYIQLLSAGLDRVPIDYITKHHIVLNDAKGVYSIPIAEFILCGILQLYKESRFFYENQSQKNWIKNRSIMELHGKTVCIIGTGSIGTETAKRMVGFTDNIYGVDLFSRENIYMKKVYPVDRLDDVLAESDIVILTLPLTEQTRNMFDKNRFSVMKDHAVFVNMARGGLVDEEALCQALDNKLFGAVCDVFQTEPLLKSSKLWHKKNLIITPHNSFVSEQNNERMWKVVYENIRNFANK